jgi:hypothetical protein
MRIHIIVVLLLYSGAVSGGLQNVLRLAEFIADIYQQFAFSSQTPKHNNKVRINCVLFIEDIACSE